MAQIVALASNEQPPEGVRYVLVTIDVNGLQVISNAAEGTTFSAPDSKAALGEAVDRACVMADELGLIVYMRFANPTVRAEAEPIAAKQAALHGAKLT